MKLLEKGKKWLLMTWVFQGGPETKGQCLPWKSDILFMSTCPSLFCQKEFGCQ